MEFSFSGKVFEWRGPSPFHFVALPPAEAEEVADQVALVTYGWGMVPVSATIGSTDFTTSLWPKNDTFFLPIKDVVRRREQIEIGDTVSVKMALRKSR